MATKEELQEEIEQLKKKVQEVQDKLEILAESDNLNEVEYKPDVCGDYYYITDDNSVGLDTWCNSKLDTDRLLARNVFEKREEAYVELKRTTVRRKLETLARHLNKEHRNKIGMESVGSEAYHIYRSKYTDCFDFVMANVVNAPVGAIMCEDTSFLKKAIQYIGESDLIQFCRDEQ
jgi:hypothetical protein